MKIIVVMPVKNEEWILEKSLAAASLVADHIIVADQNSVDKTQEICQRFTKVIYIENPSEKFNEEERRKILLTKAREFDGNNLIFALDADEILSADILEKNVLEDFFNSMKPGMSAQLQWIMLWKDPLRYRYDNSAEWSNNWKHFVYFDDRKMSFDDVKIHSSRAPKEAILNSMRFNKFRVLHYQFVDWNRMLSKNRFYEATEKTLFPEKLAAAIAPKYKWFLREPGGGAVINDVPPQWIKPYFDKGIDLKNFSKEDFHWYDVEVLKFFRKYGLSYFKWLDIWDVDWEKKRQLALQKGIANLPEYPIKDPRPIYIKFYHRYSRSFLSQGSLAHKLYMSVKKW